jgi:hypothetical protein
VVAKRCRAKIFGAALICPWSQAPQQKIFCFSENPNQVYILCRPVPLRGRLAIVTDAERDAVDVDAPLTNGVEADGESVWS